MNPREIRMADKMLRNNDIPPHRMRSFFNGYLVTQLGPECVAGGLSVGVIDEVSNRQMFHDCVKFLIATKIVVQRWLDGSNDRKWQHAGAAFSSARNGGSGYTGEESETVVTEALNAIACGFIPQVLQTYGDGQLRIQTAQDVDLRAKVAAALRL